MLLFYFLTRILQFDVLTKRSAALLPDKLQISCVDISRLESTNNEWSRGSQRHKERNEEDVCERTDFDVAIRGWIKDIGDFVAHTNHGEWKRGEHRVNESLEVTRGFVGYSVLNTEMKEVDALNEKDHETKHEEDVACFRSGRIHWGVIARVAVVFWSSEDDA